MLRWGSGRQPFSTKKADHKWLLHHTRSISWFGIRSCSSNIMNSSRDAQCQGTLHDVMAKHLLYRMSSLCYIMLLNASLGWKVFSQLTRYEAFRDICAVSGLRGLRKQRTLTVRKNLPRVLIPSAIKTFAFLHSGRFTDAPFEKKKWNKRKFFLTVQVLKKFDSALVCFIAELKPKLHEHERTWTFS